MALQKKKSLYEMMLRVRRFEETALDAGACAALNPDGYITSTHRGHGHALAKGARSDRCLAEL